MLRKREGMDIFTKNMDRIVKPPYNGVLDTYISWIIDAFGLKIGGLRLKHKYSTSLFLTIIGI